MIVRLKGLLVNSNAGNGPADLVELTLERSKGTRDISIDNEVDQVFRSAAQRAFDCFWPETESEGVTCLIRRIDGGTLPKIKGPSMGAAFAVGMIALASGSEGNGTTGPSVPEDATKSRTARMVRIVRMGLPHIVISAGLGDRCEGGDIHIGRVEGVVGKDGSFGPKVLGMQGIQVLAVSDGQKDLDKTHEVALRQKGICVLRAGTIKELMRRLADLVSQAAYFV